MKNQIKAIYFDIGGVLLDDGMSIFLDHLARKYPIPGEESRNEYKVLFQTGTEARNLRKGKINFVNFLTEVENQLQSNYGKGILSDTNADSLLNTWADGYQPIETVWDLVERIGEIPYLNMGIISANFAERFEIAFNAHSQFRLFDRDQIHLTCTVGLDKKDPAFYEEVAKRIKEPLDQLIYIDDKAPYVAAAKEAGFINSFIYNHKKSKEGVGILEQIPMLKKAISA